METTVTVQQFITIAIATSGKSDQELARELGYQSTQSITLLKNGRVKVPIERVSAFANALGVDAKALMSTVLNEYMSDSWQEIRRVYGLSD
jgi:hypothetical protein